MRPGITELKNIRHIGSPLVKFLPLLQTAVIVILLLISGNYYLRAHSLQTQTALLQKEKSTQKKALEALKNEDQYKINQTLMSEIKSINSSYKNAMKLYESLVDAKDSGIEIKDADTLFASTLNQLSEKNYASAEASLLILQKSIDEEKKKSTSTGTAASISLSTIAVNNAPPSGGYQRQKVSTDIGEYVLDIISADLASTRVIVDTASDGDCKDNCPVLPLGEYVSRNGAYAGINGTYFCPASYPSCAGKTNSFDLLVMNKNKQYFNSDNNVYSTNPAVIFGSGWVRFVGRALEWGRDTGVDGVISNFPLMVSGGQVVFGGDGDPKKGSKGSRGFVAAKGSTVYIGVVHSATVAEAAHALKALGVENAMNLDSGGSTALWYSGYKAGPGRNIPNAILFVRK